MGPEVRSSPVAAPYEYICQSYHPIGQRNENDQYMSTDLDLVNGYMAQMTNDGWELVTVIPSPPTDFRVPETLYYWRRPLG